MSKILLISQQKQFIDRLRSVHGEISLTSAPYIRELIEPDISQIKKIMEYWYLDYASTIYPEFDFENDIQKYISLMKKSLTKESGDKYYVYVAKKDNQDVVTAVLGYTKLGNGLRYILSDWLSKQNSVFLEQFFDKNLSSLKLVDPEKRFNDWVDNTKPIEIRSLYKHPLIVGAHNTGRLLLDHVIREAKKNGHSTAAFYSRMMWAYAKSMVYDKHPNLIDIGVYPIHNIPAQIYLVPLT